MFSKEAIALYKSIHAPASLQESVERKLQQPISESKPVHSPVKAWRTVLASAACIAVIIAVGVFAFPGNTLKVDGQTIGYKPVAVTSYEEINRSKNLAVAVALPVIIEMEVANDDVEVAVSSGHWEKNSVKGKTVITWDLGVPAETPHATLTLTIDGETTQYLLYGDDQGVFYMEKKK